MSARLLFLSAIIFCSLLVNAQNLTYLDSILANKTPEEQFDTLAERIHMMYSSDFTKRLTESKKLLQIAEEIDEKKRIATAYYQLAYSYEVVGEYDLAMESALSALKLFKELDDKKMQSKCFNELGLIFLYNSDTSSLQQSIYYFHKFLSSILPLKDTMDIAGAYSNIGLAYTYLKSYDSAMFYTKKGLYLREKINNKFTMGISYCNVAYIMSLTNKNDSVLYYNSKALEIHREKKYLMGISEVYGGIITHYLNIKNYDSAKVYAFKGLELAEKIGSKHILKNSYYVLVRYYKAINDYENAFKYMELYQKLSDDIKSEKSLEKINTLQTIYDFERKENQIALLEEKDRVNKLKLGFLIIGIVLILIISFIIIYSVRKKRLQDKAIHNAEKQVHIKDKQLAEAELEKSKLKEEELNKEIEFKSKQLTTHALNMMQKNKLLQELQKNIIDITKRVDSDLKPDCRRLKTSIDRNMQAEKDWELFKNYFEDVNKGFYDKLREINPDLSTNDYRLSALIKLNMNIKETASVLNLSPDSVKTARYRLRKKLALDGEVDLYDFISQVE